MAVVFNSLTDVKLATLLSGGAVGVLPTDTLYGLVCVAENKEAVTRLYSLKARDKKPGTLVAANREQLEEVGFKHRYLKAVEQFWPGPISIILPLSDKSKTYLSQGVLTLAVRISADKKLNQLLNKTGPLLTTSANLPGEPSANTIDQARVYFDNNVNFFVDGGDLSDRKPSTVIRIIDDAVEILREGAVTIDESGRIIK